MSDILTDDENREKMLCEMRGLTYIRKKKEVIQIVNEAVNQDQLFDVKSLFVEKKEEVVPIVEVKKVEPLFSTKKKATTLTEESF